MLVVPLKSTVSAFVLKVDYTQLNSIHRCLHEKVGCFCFQIDPLKMNIHLGKVVAIMSMSALILSWNRSNLSF